MQKQKLKRSLKELEINKIMETKDIAKETIEVFKYLDASLIENISKSFLDFLEELSQESNIIVNIDSN